MGAWVGVCEVGESEHGITLPSALAFHLDLHLH